MRSKTINFLLLLSAIVCVFGVSSYMFEKGDLKNIISNNSDNGDYTLYKNYEINRGYRYNTHVGPLHDLIVSDTTEKYSTETFTETQLPRGSYVEIADGYKFRPEVWMSTSYRAEFSEKEVLSNEKYYLDDVFWDKYNYVCFTISSDGGTLEKDDIEEAFKIYVPNK